MIRALILKLALRGAMDVLNHRRKDRIVASYLEDAVLICSKRFSMSGGRKGKAAIKDSFDECFDQFVAEHCMAMETFIRNIFGPGLTNTIAIRFHATRTNKAGMVFPNIGLGALKSKGGKVVEQADSCSDVDRLPKVRGE